jgi:hypothetical protein
MAIVIVMIPPAMPASIVFIESDARAIVSVTVVITVAAHVDANTGSIGEGRSAHR